MSQHRTNQASFNSSFCLAAALVFAAASIAVVSAARRKPAAPPSMPELARRIHEFYPDWKTFPVYLCVASGNNKGAHFCFASEDDCAGFWIITDAETTSRLHTLARRCDDGQNWHGVVIVVNHSAKEPCEQYQIDGNGFHAFGDPNILEKIAPLLH